MSGKKRTVSGFGERLIKLRKARGLTQVELAKAVGVTQAIISKYENAVSDPASAVAAEIARTLGVSVDTLLGFTPMKASAAAVTQSRSLWKRFQQMQLLPQRDQRAVIRLLNSLVRSQQPQGNARDT